MVKIALVEIANTANIKTVNEGEYRLTLPDGSQVSPVYAGWVGENYMLVPIILEEVPTYLYAVNIGSNTGLNYVVNDILTISGGVSVGNVAQVQVFGVEANGKVSSVLISNSGYYTSKPEVNDNPLTGGLGTGLTAMLTMRAQNIANTTYTYDSGTQTVIQDHVFVTPVIDNSQSVEMQRQRLLNQDASNQGLKNRLATATPAQIDAWLLSNVTDLASARTVLGTIVKFLANKFNTG